MPTKVYLKHGTSKVLLVSGKVALESACCCCPGVMLVCDSISASKSKCGLKLQDPPHPANCYETLDITAQCDSNPNVYSNSTDCKKLYLVRTETTTACPAAGCSGSFVTTTTYDPATCASPTIVCSGSITCGATTYNCPGSSYASLHNTIGHQQLSSEYTTAALISNTVAALPAYDDDFNDTCSSTRSLSSDETSYTISRFKHKWTFSSAPVGMTIDWNEHFVPTSGSPVDTARNWTAAGGETETDVFTVNEPSTNGTTTITDVVVACP